MYGFIFNAGRETDLHSYLHHRKSQHYFVHHLFSCEFFTPQLPLLEPMNRVSRTIMGIQFDDQKHEERAHVFFLVDDQVDVPRAKLQSDTLPRVKR